MTGQESALEGLVADGRHPNFARVLSAMDFDMDLDALFEFGLQRLLSGIVTASGERAGLDGVRRSVR
jgi:hypothetical protein